MIVTALGQQPQLLLWSAALVDADSGEATWATPVPSV
jgi:hypothetical protein